MSCFRSTYATPVSRFTTGQQAVAWLSSYLALVLIVAASLRGSAQAKPKAGATGTLAARIASVLPTPQEERWLEVPWRLDLVQARAEAQRSGKPLFLWINEGHPLGCV